MDDKQKLLEYLKRAIAVADDCANDNWGVKEASDLDDIRAYLKSEEQENILLKTGQIP